MAMQNKLRYKPDQFRSGLEALVLGETGDGSTGTVVLTVQAIQYDNLDIANINAVVFGDPDAEKFINVLYEGTIQMDIPTLDAMTNTNRVNALRAALDNWGTANYGLIQKMAVIVRNARRMQARNLVAP